MRILPLLLTLLAPPFLNAQTPVQTVSPAQLQAVTGLPLDQAIKAREAFKAPLRAAYARQINPATQPCRTELNQGQQFYNACLGKAGETADDDFALFFNNLQMLCHDQAELSALQQAETHWISYRESAMQAAHATWPDGTGAPAFAGEIYLTLLHDHMRELFQIYGLNISQ